jgi:glycine cleavage system H protein
MAETKAPQGHYFTEKHEWVRPDGESATIGISDYAQQALGDIVFVDVPKVGKSITQSDSFGTIESVKAAEDLYAPVSGEIIAINPIIESDPAAINADPFGTWFIKINGFSQADLSKLMDASQYKDYIAGLE